MTTGDAALAGVPAHVPPRCVVDFDIYDPPGAEQDFHAAWATFQQSGVPDVIWTPRNGGHWLPTRGEDVHAIMGDWEHFSNRKNVVPAADNLGRDFIPLQLDPPEHGLYRRLVTQAFLPKFLRELSGTMDELTVSLIEGMKGRGECEFISEFAEVFPITIFLLLVGLPVEHRKELRALGEQLNRPDGTMTHEMLMETVNQYLAPHVAARLAAPGTDLFSRILAMPLEGRPWTVEEAMRLCRNIFFGGLDTVAAMIGFIAHYLARHPDAYQALRADPELIGPAADEFLRRFSSTLLTREVAKDHELRGVILKAGDLIVLPNLMHNLDGRCFPDAMQVDFRRGLVEHSTMGNGPHRCAGATLARMEVVTFLREWTARIPSFAIKSGATVKMQPGGVGAVIELPLCWPAPD